MKPEPVPTSLACSCCGLGWTLHKHARGKVAVSECVRLLKAELARRPNYFTTSGTTSGTSNGVTFTCNDVGSAA